MEPPGQSGFQVFLTEMIFPHLCSHETQIDPVAERLVVSAFPAEALAREVRRRETDPARAAGLPGPPHSDRGCALAVQCCIP
jgi:hypothetical protein